MNWVQLSFKDWMDSMAVLPVGVGVGRVDVIACARFVGAALGRIESGNLKIVDDPES